MKKLYVGITLICCSLSVKAADVCMQVFAEAKTPSNVIFAENVFLNERAKPNKEDLRFDEELISEADAAYLLDVELKPLLSMLDKSPQFQQRIRYEATKSIEFLETLISMNEMRILADAYVSESAREMNLEEKLYELIQKKKLDSKAEEPSGIVELDNFKKKKLKHKLVIQAKNYDFIRIYFDEIKKRIKEGYFDPEFITQADLTSDPLNLGNMYVTINNYMMLEGFYKEVFDSTPSNVHSLETYRRGTQQAPLKPELNDNLLQFAAKFSFFGSAEYGKLIQFNDLFSEYITNGNSIKLSPYERKVLQKEVDHFNRENPGLNVEAVKALYEEMFELSFILESK